MSIEISQKSMTDLSKRIGFDHCIMYKAVVVILNGTLAMKSRVSVTLQIKS